MRTLALIIIGFILMSFSGLQPNFDIAKQNASAQHKLILLTFSGSDWCGPCILFQRDVIEDDQFTQFADSSLIIVHADFPRQKKNQLPEELQKENNSLADMYNKKGIFPLVLLMSADGKVLKTWEGKPKESNYEFIHEIKTVIDSNK